jgi:hypothetical protein
MFGLSPGQAYEGDYTVMEAEELQAQEELQEAERLECEGKLKAEEVDLFRKKYHEAQEKAKAHFGHGAYLNWISIDDMWALPLGERGTLVLVPSKEGDWDVALLKGRNEFETLGGGLDVSYAQSIAENYIAEDNSMALAKREIRWRKGHSTEGQMKFLENMIGFLDDYIDEYSEKNFISKGEAADLISIALVRRAFSQSVRGGPSRRKQLSAEAV